MSRPLTTADFEPEQEIDLGRYAAALAARWWLALLGVLAGALVGYALALGGADVYRAQALVDLGSPQGPGGTGGAVQNPSLLVTTGREIARADDTVRRVAAETGLRRGKLRSGISAKPVTGGTGKAAATTLLQITVQGESRRKVALASNAIARVVVARVSPYVTTKIQGLKAQIAADAAELKTINALIAGELAQVGRPGVSPTVKLIALGNVSALEQRRATTREDSFDRKQALALAENVERPRLLERGVAGKTTARSGRNSAVVGAVIGLLLGLAAALAWDPVAAAVARRRT
jgi:uncharacterized protein involved in exopolysaccharide biosynthesis